jgi:ankyrin repeat protein
VQEKYSEWLVGDSLQLLRLVGAPGIGKTMLSSFLVDELERKARTTPRMTFAYYFCDNKDDKRKTATAIIRGLLVQLLQQHPGLFKYIQPKYNMIGDDLFIDFDALWLILVLIIKDFGGGELYLLMDALDECEKKSRQAFLNKLANLSDENLNVKVLITCRPEPEIEDIFRGKKGSLYIHLDNINTDLSRFIDVKVKELVDRKGWKTKEEQTIKEALQKNADGTFLWVSLVLEDISTVIHIPSIKHKLRTLPSSLLEVYTRIMSTIDNADVTVAKVAKLMLQIIVAARRPLTVSELAMAYVLAPSSPEKWDGKKIPSLEYLEDFRDSFKCCGLLIYHDEATDTINLIHQSAKDYLLDQYLKDPKENPQDDAALASRLNLLILEICCIYLGMQDFDYLSKCMVFKNEWAIDWEPQWWEIDVPPVFLSYAGWGWEFHAIQAESIAVQELERIEKCLKRPTLLNSWLRRTAFYGKEDIAKWLLASGADVNAGDFRGWTPLQIAARNGHRKMVIKLIEAQANVNASAADVGGRTALQAAAGEGHAEIVADLLKAKADVNAAAADIDGRTALQAAAEGGHLEVVVQLLRAGADVNAPAAGFQGWTALLAAAGGEYEVAQKSQPVVEKRHEAVVSELLDAGADPNIASSEGWTALHAAAERGSLPMVTQMLSCKTIKVNNEAIFKGTPRLAAQVRGHQTVISELVMAGAKGDYSQIEIDFDAK